MNLLQIYDSGFFSASSFTLSSFEDSTGATTVNTSITNAGAELYTGIITPTAIVGPSTTNNYAPTGFATASTIRQQATTGLVTITGLAGGADIHLVAWNDQLSVQRTEVLIEMLKKGATDYVLKTRLARLAPSVNRALREMPLWRTAISLSGNRSRMRERSCVVRAISGTR